MKKYTNTVRKMEREGFFSRPFNYVWPECEPTISRYGTLDMAGCVIRTKRLVMDFEEFRARYSWAHNAKRGHILLSSEISKDRMNVYVHRVPDAEFELLVEQGVIFDIRCLGGNESCPWQFTSGQCKYKHLDVVLFTDHLSKYDSAG